MMVMGDDWRVGAFRVRSALDDWARLTEGDESFREGLPGRTGSCWMDMERAMSEVGWGHACQVNYVRDRQQNYSAASEEEHRQGFGRDVKGISKVYAFVQTIFPATRPAKDSSEKSVKYANIRMGRWIRTFGWIFIGILLFHWAISAMLQVIIGRVINFQFVGKLRIDGDYGMKVDRQNQRRISSVNSFFNFWINISIPFVRARI